MFVVSFSFIFFGDTLTSNNISCGPLHGSYL